MSSPFQFREGGEEGEQPLLLPGDGGLLCVTLAQQGSVLDNENILIFPPQIINSYLVLRLEILVHQVTNHGWIKRRVEYVSDSNLV